MNIDFNTLLVGFFGSLVGVFLTGTYGRITTANKLNRTRKILLNYIQTIAIPKCEKYIEDVKSGIEIVENFEKFAPYGNKENDRGKLDYMPMLNSDIFKSFNPEVLLQTSYNTETHSSLIEITYTIEFLKKHMTYDKIADFINKLRTHLDKKNISDIDIQHHLQSCSYYRKLKDRTLYDFDLKTECALELKEELDKIVHQLEGNQTLWLMKYGFRQ